MVNRQRLVAIVVKASHQNVLLDLLNLFYSRPKIANVNGRGLILEGLGALTSGPLPPAENSAQKENQGKSSLWSSQSWYILWIFRKTTNLRRHFTVKGMSAGQQQ